MICSTNIPSVFRIFSGLALILSCCFCAGESADEKIYDSDLLGKDTETSILAVHEELPLRIELDKQQIEKGKTSSFLRVEDVIYLSNELPVGAVDKVLFWEDRIYILDRHITQSLLCFDQRGKFLYAVGVVGEGPGEIRKIYDAQVNPYTDLLDIWDGPGQKLMTFDRDGHLVREIPVDIFAAEFAPIDSSVYLFHKGNLTADPSLHYKFIAIDIRTKEVNGKYFPLKDREELFKFRSANVLQRNYYNDHYYFVDPFDYNVYSFTSQRLARDFFVDCEDQAIPAGLISFQKPQQELVDLLYDPNYFGLIEMPFETADHIYFSINNGVDIIHNIHNKHSGATKSYRQLEDDIAAALIGRPITVNETGEVFYSIDPGLLKMIVESKSKHLGLTESELIDRWKSELPLAYDIYRQVDEFDNPILVKCRFTI